MIKKGLVVFTPTQQVLPVDGYMYFKAIPLFLAARSGVPFLNGNPHPDTSEVFLAGENERSEKTKNTKSNLLT